MRDRQAPRLRLVRDAGTAVRPVRLFTATIGLTDGGGTFELFHACRVACRDEVLVRLACRIAPSIARSAVVREGIDPRDPIVGSLLPAGTAHQLERGGDLPGSALSGGGDLHIVQRRG